VDPRVAPGRYAHLHGEPRAAEDEAARTGREARAAGLPVIVVSACLCGAEARWDGGHRHTPAALARAGEAVLLPLCPEVLGGLGCPRPPCALEHPDGAAVLTGASGARDDRGAPVGAALRAGAERMAALAVLAGATSAVLKQSSPSCGTRRTHVLAAGSAPFSTAEPGRGVAAAALAALGLPLLDEDGQ
jgi:uncharacterized protein YbbK (DUF523 family)